MKDKIIEKQRELIGEQNRKSKYFADIKGTISSLTWDNINNKIEFLESELSELESQEVEGVADTEPSYPEVTDNEIDQVACDEMQQDWNDLRFQKVYKEGFIDGAKWIRRRLNEIKNK